MTATDELRHMLDERGVEWRANDTYRLLVTSLNDASSHSWAFMEHRDGSFSKLTAYRLTPEQAIAATVGTGTCGLKKCETTWFEKGETTWFAGYNGYVTEWTCDECGGLTFYDAEMRPRFCANCGRKAAE